jgi:integrase
MGESDDGDRLAQILAVVQAQGAQLAALTERFGPKAAPAVASTLTWRDAWEYYDDDASERVSSLNTDRGRWKHIDRHLGGEAVAETTVDTLKAYRKERKAEFTKRKTLTTPKTRNNEIELMRRMSRLLHRRKKTPSDPFSLMTQAEIFEPVENVRRNVVEDDPNATLTLDQLTNIGDELDRALVLVAHSSGMRRGEIAALEWDWIDRTPDKEGRPLRIVRIPPGISKGKKGKREGRETWISVDALAAINAYRKTLPFPLQRRAVHVFINARTGKDGRPGKYWGKHLHKDYLTERFERIRERAEAIGPSGPVWLHDLRRSFITLARRRNEDTSNVKQASGHTTDAAFDRYDIHARQDVIATRDRVEAARDADLAAISAQRKGPHSSHVGTSAHNTDREKNNG